MTTKHNPTPWEVRFAFTRGAAHAVECVNALAGLNPEAIPDAIEWIQDKSRESCQCTGLERGWCDHCVATDILAALRGEK